MIGETMDRYLLLEKIGSGGMGEVYKARHTSLEQYRAIKILPPHLSMNKELVERFFRDLTQNRLKRGVFRDIEELIIAIGDYIDKHNLKPKPFIWTAKATDILQKVTRARQALHNVRSA